MGSKLRKAALAYTIKHITYEDENTRFIDIGPVNKAVNMLCQWFHNPDGAEFKKHCARVADYLWVAEDGMKMQGYNGSQLWDTAFAVQAVASTGLAAEFSGCLKLAHSYIERSQVQENTAGEYSGEWFRHLSKGAWPFSTRDHGWRAAPDHPPPRTSHAAVLHAGLIQRFSFLTLSPLFPTSLRSTLSTPLSTPLPPGPSATAPQRD